MPTNGTYNTSFELEKVVYQDDVVDIEVSNAENPIFVTGISDRIMYPYVILIELEKEHLDNKI